MTLKENLPAFPKTAKAEPKVIEKHNNELFTSRDNTLWTLNKSHEKEQIIEALNQANGNKTIAAKLLQIDRKTLYNKMHTYDIEL